MTIQPIEISVKKIKANPFQPRKHFPEKEQRQLQENIRKNGLIQPIVVRKSKDGFEILAGERRFRAIQNLGLPTVSAIVREISDEEMQVLSIIENVQREDLSPIDLANSFKKLTENLNYTQEKLALQLGKDRSTITNSLRLLELPKRIQDDIDKRLISPGHGRALLTLKDSKKAFILRDKIIKKKLSVRETEKQAKAMLSEKRTYSQTITKNQKDPNTEALEKQLSLRLGTKVEIWGEKEGSIQIEFSTVQEFNRIFNSILEQENDL